MGHTPVLVMSGHSLPVFFSLANKVRLFVRVNRVNIFSTFFSRSGSPTIIVIP